LRVYTLKEEKEYKQKEGFWGGMEALKRQASKLREQVAKQQQVVLKILPGLMDSQSMVCIR